MPFDLATKEGIAAAVRQDLRNLWAKGGEISKVQRLASENLQILTSRAGYNPGPDALKALCHLPKHLVRSEERYRRVHEHRTDIKAFHDKRGRVSRTSAGEQPMRVVYGDVHHMDVLVTRADGSSASPKMIAWFDVGTRRFRCDLVLVDKGKMVRNADLIASFLNTTQDEHWGLPRFLSLDNGSEYLWADFVQDALKLTHTRLDWAERDGAVIRAIAHNAPGKALIEGGFGNLTRNVFSALPGYVGGNRMQSKTANMGRAPVPFDGTFEDLESRVQGLVTFYNTHEQNGQLKGRSPNETYRRWVLDGDYERTTIDPHALMMAFAIEETRKVTKEAISIDSDVYTCPGLARVNGERVEILKPKYQEWPAIPVWSPRGEFVGYATTQRQHPFLDKAGAEEAAGKLSNSIAAVRELQAEVQEIDLVARMIASGERVEALPVPSTTAVVAANSERAAIGRGIAEHPGDRADRQHREREEAHNRRVAFLKRRYPSGGAG